MSARPTLLGILLLVLLAGILAGLFLMPAPEWTGGPRLQITYEVIGACIAFEVAAFAVSRFGLERRRLPLFIGLAYLAAVTADVVAALLAHGTYFVPLTGETNALRAVWTAGRVALAGFLVVGVIAESKWPFARRARDEMIPGLLLGAGLSFAMVHGATMMEWPVRAGEIFAGLLMAVALAGFWRVYRQSGGTMVASVLVSLVAALFAELFMLRSETLFDGFHNLALALKVGSYLPPLVGLFVESVTLFRAQTKLTKKLQVAQAELQEYSKTLELKVADRTRELETRAKDLEAFAYTVSHDLKAPLRGMQTYAQLLLAEKLDAEGRRYAESVNKAATNMRQLIDDLLAYSRLERREAEIGRVNLRELAESVLEQTGRAAVVDVQLPEIPGDRAMLQQALANLVDNAFKYGGKHVVVRGREQKGECVLSVRDDGIGFDMQYREKIFEIFQRLHRADEIEGTGIGLSIVKRAVEKHKGRVWAESEPGKGATFYIVIPT
jgi:signal transduction histidine kinase